MTAWTTQPFVIHVNGDPTAEMAAASAAGAVVRTLPLAGLHSLAQVDELATEVFEIPHPPGGFASMLDWLTDLEWLDVEDGVLMVIDMRDATSKVAEGVLGVLAYIVQWWRLWPQPTVVHVTNMQDPAAARRVILEGGVPQVGRPMALGAAPAEAVEVVVHSSPS